MTLRTHLLGFPRMGENRELKFALERHWRGEIGADELEKTGYDLRVRHWELQRAAGLDFVTVGDFAFYDQMANHIQLLGCEPARFGFLGDEPELSRYFTLARGVAREGDEKSRPALEMTKWFDTNYHYLVPEFSADTNFALASERIFTELAEARRLGHPVKAVLIGPLTFLWLGKEKTPGFSRLDLLEKLLPVYRKILARLCAEGADWVQIDEPILGLDLPSSWQQAFEPAYHRLASANAQVLLATYFSPLKENFNLACRLPVAGLHIDAVRAPEDALTAADWLPAHRVLSLGLIDGRNVWRADLDRILDFLRFERFAKLREIWLAPSCSLLHVPFCAAAEKALDGQLRSWLSFAVEKLQELQALKNAAQENVEGEALAARFPLFAQSRAVRQSRKDSPRVHAPEVAARLAALPADIDRRKSSYPVRRAAQDARFSLPLLPTTTIGSFPQTAAVRALRAAFRGGKTNLAEYTAALQEKIRETVAIQEELGLDVLVHGEAERNDMVEYFGEQLAGFAFTANGWVQSYGSRCVKPPILYGDVSRPRPMTVEWSRFAQGLTEKPMKGMLTGPVTILQWSFVRDDQPRATTAEQIALAIRDEVVDLEKAGIGIIQIDEPAIREGLPPRREYWGEYLAWATRVFRVAASGVQDATQIHTHMCYSEFHDILPEIASMDADVITIETSRSDMELLRAFGNFHYPNAIGPGVYDIHSPRVPPVAEIEALLTKALSVIPAERLWVNPDCGLKTRDWPETKAALANMVEAARRLRGGGK
ncbi:MAG: 5-methyltetrahydropteroyltriglutamate--homocysteine S-methyltransferase [Zoogloeaceae bacterium]|jgi:5-methyltetrahydropteroyltriglutamate--homocysteine methyltransferase|nr:5-methyltetrahydropteroyltriglutamate--homocysteine S-methyltransferase [Zoogloeaceae bacterium]